MLDPSNLADSHGIHSTDVAAFQGQAGPVLVGQRRDQQATGDIEEIEARARTLSAAIELSSTLDAAVSLRQAAEEASRALVRHLSARRVVVLWRRSDRTGLTILAESDTKEEDTDSDDPSHRLTVAAGEEIAARDDVTYWPPQHQGEAHALMAVAQLARAMSAEKVLGVGLIGSHDAQRGVLIVVDPGTDSALGLVSVLALSLGSKLTSIERLQPTRWESKIRAAAEFLRGSRRKVLLWSLIAISVLMLLPVRYRVTTELELQPVKQRFVAVPFDGALQRAHVRSGDLVDKDQLLATINPREIELELASTRAELNRALQEKKGLMAEHDSAGSKIAALESERLRLKTDLLQYRRDHLEIRSPISGLVVSGDLEQSEGMPMSRGETLFEIAPLGQVVVELAVPENDFAHVRKGMSVRFYVHAFPGRNIHGIVDRIHPRAELRDHDNVYIAELRVSDPDNLLRPGMRGRGKIISDRHTLGWNLFHRAYYALRHALGV